MQAQLNDDQNRKEARTRSAIIREVNYALLISMTISSLAFILFSYLERNTQYLIGAASLTISGILTYPIWHARRTQKLDIAAIWMLMGIVLSYGIAEFFWANVTVQITGGCVMLIILVTSVTLPRKWPIGLIALIIICTFFLYVNIAEPVQRYNTMPTNIPSLIFASTMFTIFVILWQVVRTNRYLNALQEHVINLQEKDEDLQRELHELSLLHSLAVAATEATNEDELIRHATELIGTTLYPNSFGILLLNPESKTLKAHPSYAIDPQLKPLQPVVIGQGVIGTSIADGQPRLVPDVRQFPGYIETDPRVCSELCVPLHVGGEIIGVVNAESYKYNAFTESDERFLIIFAGQLATAIARLRNVEETRNTAAQFEILRQASQEILSAGLDSTSVYEAIHKATQELMPSEAFVIAKIDEINQQIQLVYAVDKTGLVVHNPIPLGEGLTSHVVLSGKPVLASDVSQIDEFDAIHFGDPESVRSVLAVPLRIGGKIYGMLSAQSYVPNAHTLQDQTMLEMLGAHAAAALENTRLFAAEHQRTIELEALRIASLNLTSSLEAKEVLQLILQSTLSMVKADDAHIFLYDGERLSFGAARWRDQAQTKPFSNPRPHGVTYTVAKSGQPLIIPSTKQHAMFADTDWDNAIAGLPLLIGDLVVGVMNVAYHQPHDFDENELRSLRLLADQAAIAIRNAELFESTQRQIQELKLLYHLALSGAETTDEDKLVSKVTELIGESLYPDNFGILLLDDDGDSLRIHSSYQPSKQNLQNRTIPLGQGITGTVAQKGSALRIPNIQEDEVALRL
ncbi:MAG: GAF domain-containing protein, partial [Anaerolineae bacterium]|nr:GAF domain-containing protein [Anaerolineae bacterium]